MSNPPQFKYDVIHPEPLDKSASFTVTVHIDVIPGKESDILAYLRGQTLRRDLQSSWGAENAPGFGVEQKGAPHPIFKNPADRSSGVVAYETDYRFNRPI